ncbi:MAG: PD-(D/E)XK nuclease family protein, partial [Alphaproteobacteria bacterium]|nr:PD-(D/E)XK nuclease family protein [Alphaproteobacteria bacterium]
SLLQRWDIRIDDSGGGPLSLSPAGAFLNLAAAAAAPQAGVCDLLALLKHPLAACGLSPAACRAKAREEEIRARTTEDANFDWANTLLRPLSENWDTPRPLTERLTRHIETAEALAASSTEPGAARLWDDESGEAAAQWLDELKAAAADFPDLKGDDYLATFATLSSMKTLRSSKASHPRLSILGPLEARMCDADLIVLGGMNEGVWPPDPGFDPWMSRPMRKKFGLSSPEYRIGQSAHDFVQLAAAREVLITRSSRSGGVPTVPSRFLLQIETVLRAAGLTNDTHDALAPREPWRAWASALDAPPPGGIRPCERPLPCPPVELRPKTLSVTEISTWRRNPYAIYAEHILKLKKLDELDQQLDASDKGSMIHEALEKFSEAYPQTLPPDALDRLLELGQNIFAQDKGDPRVRAFWEAGFRNIAAWIVDEERKRREAGVTSVLPEAEGQYRLGTFTLKGRADRIEKLSDGSIRIVDYKTGSVPSKTEVYSGIEPQLQLLALMASAGSFESVGPADISACEYWSLKGGRTGSDAKTYDKDLPELIEKAKTGLKGLIEEFADPQTIYEAVPRASIRPHHNNYAHLSRIAEWTKTGEDS